MKKTLFFLITIVTVIILVLIILKQINISKNKKHNIFYEANTIEEIEQLKEKNKPMIIAFGADYCPTCVNYLPYIKEISSQYSDEIIIKYVDTVKNENIRKEYNIELIPSTIFYDKNGNAYQPSMNLEVECIEEPVQERKYISDFISIANGKDLCLNEQFEYGINKNNEIVYSKFVGLLDMIQLKQIINELLDSELN